MTITEEEGIYSYGSGSVMFQCRTTTNMLTLKLGWSVLSVDCVVGLSWAAGDPKASRRYGTEASEEVLMFE